MTRQYGKIRFILFLIVFAYLIGLVAFWFASDASVGFSLDQNDTVIGSSASVQPNQFNKAAEQLKIKETALLEKEEDILREKNFLQAEVGRGQQKILIYLAVIGGGLFVLILLNFYFDSRRKV